MKPRQFFVLASALLLAFATAASACGDGRSEAERHYDRGNELLGEGRYEEAIMELDQAVDLNPDLAGAYVSRGTANRELGDLEEAIFDYDRAISLDSSFAAAYANRGEAYSELGNIEHALADLERALSLTDDSDSRAEFEERIAELKGE